MKRAIIRLAYVILGFLIGLMAAMKFVSKVSAHPNGFIIAFVIVGIIIALIVEASIEMDSKKIFYLIFFYVLSYPVACLFQYLWAIVILLWKIFKVLLDIWF